MINKRLFKLLGNKITNIYKITAWQLVNLLLSVFISYCFCGIVVHRISMPTLIMIISVFVCMLIKRFITIHIGKLQATITDELQINLRGALLTKVEEGLGQVAGYSLASLSQLMIEGIEQLNLYYTSFLPQFFYAMSAPIILCIIVSRFHYKVALMFLVCVPLIPISIIAVSKYAKKIFRKYWDIYLSMGGDFLDNLNGLVELTLFQYDDTAAKEMDENAEEFRRITMKVLVMQLYSTSIMDMVAYGGSALGMALALYLFYKGEIASFSSVLFIILVGAEFFLPMRQLGSAFHISMNGSTAGDKILDILSIEKLADGTKDITAISSISCSDVSYSYGDNNVLSNVSFEITEPGLYGIVGHSGSGKSTLAKIFSKQNVDYQGNIRFNNELELASITRGSLYSKLAYISNSSHIFMNSVYDNFRFVNSNISEEEMWKALEAVCLKEFVEENGGLQSFTFKEHAHNVSGGQKQRFILAFYLYSNRDVFILDEITSNIDAESEEVIRKAIEALAKEKIVLMITHRLCNVSEAVSTLVLEKGQVMGKGTHNELMSNCEVYRNFVNQQRKEETL